MDAKKGKKLLNIMHKSIVMTIEMLIIIFNPRRNSFLAICVSLSF